MTAAYRCKCVRLLVAVTPAMYVIGCLGCSYYQIGRGLPFFSLGFLLILVKERLVGLKYRRLVGYLMLVVLIYLFEIAIVNLLRINQNIVLTLAMYPLIF